MYINLYTHAHIYKHIHTYILYVCVYLTHRYTYRYLSSKLRVKCSKVFAELNCQFTKRINNVTQTIAKIYYSDFFNLHQIEFSLTKELTFGSF